MSIVEVINFFSEGLNSNGLHLMSYLASQGNNEAVQKLVHMGQKPEEALYGYALAGDEAQVAKILASIDASDKDTFSLCTGQLIKGYARGGHFKPIYALSNYKDYSSDFVVGIAQAGNRDSVTGLLDRNIGLFKNAVEGYASANQGDLLSKLIKGTSYYPTAIYHAARAGHSTLVTNLLQQCCISLYERVAPSLSGEDSDLPASFMEINSYSFLNKAMEGYMAGLHFSNAIALLARGASIRLCIAALTDSHGLPSKELYLAFLAHIDEASLREKVLGQMSVYSKAMEQLVLTETDLAELEKTIVCMASEHLNYIEARAKVEDPTHHPVSGEISLPYLAEAWCTEATVTVTNIFR